MKEIDQNINKVMGKRLQSLRQSQGIAISELAAKTGFSRSSLQNYEAGARQPSLAVIGRLADALGCSAAWLATFSSTDSEDENLHYHLVHKPIIGQSPSTLDSVMYSVTKIKEAGCFAGQVDLMTAQDNLLSPEICQGDEVLIDTSKTTVEGADIFCIRDKSGRKSFRFARREIGRDGFTLYANNDAHFPPVFIAEGSDAIEIVGRVINVTRWR